MILERAIFAVKPGEADDFAAAFGQARKFIETSKGFRSIQMCRGIENPDSFILLVWWDTLDNHMRDFREGQGFKEWRALLGPHFASPPVVEHYEESL